MKPWGTGDSGYDRDIRDEVSAKHLALSRYLLSFYPGTPMPRQLRLPAAFPEPAPARPGEGS